MLFAFPIDVESVRWRMYTGSCFLFDNSQPTVTLTRRTIVDKTGQL